MPLADGGTVTVQVATAATPASVALERREIATCAQLDIGRPLSEKVTEPEGLFILTSAVSVVVRPTTIGGNGIIDTAKRKKCDVIVMASHGRSGLSALLLGSETTKVLTHCKLPVLVCR